MTLVRTAAAQSIGEHWIGYVCVDASIQCSDRTCMLTKSRLVVFWWLCRSGTVILQITSEAAPSVLSAPRMLVVDGDGSNSLPPLSTNALSTTPSSGSFAVCRSVSSACCVALNHLTFSSLKCFIFSSFSQRRSPCAIWQLIYLVLCSVVC